MSALLYYRSSGTTLSGETGGARSSTSKHGCWLCGFLCGLAAEWTLDAFKLYCCRKHEGPSAHFPNPLDESSMKFVRLEIAEHWDDGLPVSGELGAGEIDLLSDCVRVRPANLNRTTSGEGPIRSKHAERSSKWFHHLAATKCTRSTVCIHFSSAIPSFLAATRWARRSRAALFLLRSASAWSL